MPAVNTITFIFDKNISKIIASLPEHIEHTIESSGEQLEVIESAGGTWVRAKCSLTPGYGLDTVSGTSSNIITKTSNTTFEIVGSSQGTTFESDTITITSKILPKQKIDISTLSGWEDLTSGTHSVTIKTKASGYVDSESSNAVSVNKSVSGETWLLNETIEGTFDIIDVNFVSNAANYTRISINVIGAPIERYWLHYNDNNVYNTQTGWANEAYRTITFETAPSGKLLTWLRANGVKQ